MSGAKKFIHELLAKADIQVGGSRSWDIQVHDERFYSAVLRGGEMAFGESYMAGWWDVAALDELIMRISGRGLKKEVRFTPQNISLFLTSVLRNAGAKSRAFEVGQKHYDAGNELFETMLDKRMVYSCGYWRDANNLDDAQEAKLELVCRKLGISSGERILDIGCGWGSFAKYAAEKYGVHVVGITVSNEQATCGQLCKGFL